MFEGAPVMPTMRLELQQKLLRNDGVVHSNNLLVGWLVGQLVGR